MPPPIVRTPVLKKTLHPTDQTINRIQDDLLAVMNPVLRNGTNAIQGAPVQQQQSTDDGKTITYSASTKSWILSAFSSFATLATTVIYGISRLSWPPANPADPIVVSDTDPRNSDSRFPKGPAGGALANTYPNPTLANVGTAGTYGDSTHVPQITTNAGGQVSAVTPVAIAFPPSGPTATTVDLWDDFEGYQISLRWNSTTGGAGTVGPTRISTVADAADNASGNVDLGLTGVGDWAGLDWGGAPGYLNSVANPFVGYIEWSVYLLTAGALLNVRAGFGDSVTALDAGTGASMTIGTDPSTGNVAVFINLGLGGGDVKFTTGTPFTVNAPHQLRIVFPAAVGTPRFFFDGTDTGITITGGFPSGSTTYIQPLAYAVAAAGPSGNSHAYLDYMVISRTRPTSAG